MGIPVDASTLLIWLLDKVFFAVLIGVVSSFIFLLILSRFRPNIEISPEIAEGISTIDGRKIFRIKVINKTNRAIVGIRAQLHIFKNYQTDSGEIWKSKAIELKRSEPLLIEKFDPEDKDANYAYRFLTYEDVTQVWEDDTQQFLRFRLYCQHEISGFGKCFIKDYRLKRQTIKKGDFAKGNTLKIV